MTTARPGETLSSLQLGRYQILKRLATGDVADVLLARATGLEGFARHVVIKCIRPELAGEQRLVESFIEEARIAASLHHQNVVQVHDIGEQDGAYFFAMEYVHGEDVRDLLATVRERNGLVPLDHVVAIVTATAAGLHHAHEQRNPAGEHLGLVHRDVCPANILLGYDGSVKLVDFGMARAALRSVRTATGSLKGKASYMSPEQCVGKPIDRRTDTFALGVVLYELVTARRLFKGANEFLTMASIVEGTVPPPSATRPDLPPAFDAIVLRALAREPELRYQTAEDLRAALERFAVEHQLRTSNKALADYFISLFGPRLEPWHTEAEIQAKVADFDKNADTGLVQVPVPEAELIARYAPRTSSPMMLAQSIVERPRDAAPGVDNKWTDEDEYMPTVARSPSAIDPEILRPPVNDDETRNERPAQDGPAQMAKAADDDYGQTMIEPPPDFADMENTAARELRERVAAEALGQTSPSDPTTKQPVVPSPPPELTPKPPVVPTVPPEPKPKVSVADLAGKLTTTLAGIGAPRPRRGQVPSPATYRTGGPLSDTLPAPSSELLPVPTLPSAGLHPANDPRYSDPRYVGPTLRRMPSVLSFAGRYRHPILFGAIGGLIVFIIAVISTKACGHHSKPKPAETSPIGSAR